MGTPNNGRLDIRNTIKDTPEEIALRARLKKYGLSITRFHEMLSLQSGKCAICSLPITDETEQERSKWVVDHNHRTGTIRGLLCYKCNWMLGQANDNPEILKAAATYLEKWKEPNPPPLPPLRPALERLLES